MNARRSTSSGYVLMSVLAVLLAIIAILVKTNTSYVKQITMAADTNPTVKKEIEASALAHLRAYSEQSNCNANSAQVSVSGEKNGISYTLDWQKNANGGYLRGSFSPINTQQPSWTTQVSDIELYGKTQQTAWVLAPYFSEQALIDDESTAEILYALKLGPLLTEPTYLTEARFSFTSNMPGLNFGLSNFSFHVVKYPWKADGVTSQYNGFPSQMVWTEIGDNKFEDLPLQAEREGAFNPAHNFNITGLMRSWLNGTRANNGWALSSNNNFIRNAFRNNNDTLSNQHVDLSYRCACAEVCIGIKQNQSLVLGSLSDIGGTGGAPNKISKIQLHEAHQNHLTPTGTRSALAPAYREIFTPAGLSSIELPNIPVNKEIIGLDVEPANDDHEEFHYYTVLVGTPATTKLQTGQPLSNVSDASILYFQSAADEEFGTALEPRGLNIKKTEQPEQVEQPLSTFIEDFDTYIGGMSHVDHNYYFVRQVDGVTSILNIPLEPVEEQWTEVRMPAPDPNSTPVSIGPIPISDGHVIDALQVIDQHNFLFSTEYDPETISAPYVAELGNLQAHDGDIFIYNTITGRARSINNEISRSESNNVWSIGLFEEPLP